MRYVFFALLLLAMIPLASGQAGAGNLAVVDVQYLLSESKAAKDLEKQLAKQQETFQKEIEGFEEELRGAEQALIKKRETLSEEQFLKEKQVFEGKVLEKRRILQTRKKGLDEAFGKALGTLRGKIVEIVAQIAEEEDIELVVTRQNVVIVEKTIDRTKEVLKRLDKDLPKIKLNVDKN